MTKPIQATRENLLPRTIWQNAAGTSVARIDSRDETMLSVTTLGQYARVFKPSDFMKLDLWFQVQPIKEPTT